MVSMRASSKLEVNVTSTLARSLAAAVSSWSQDFAAKNGVTERKQFVPYCLKNLTGRSLVFCPLPVATTSGTTKSAPSRDLSGHSAETEGDERTSVAGDAKHIHDDRDEIVEVLPGQEATFDFAGGREKLRHLGSRGRVVHKIALRILGWHDIQPALTVDRVGKFVFYMRPAEKAFAPARVVVSISVKNGRKLITVQSALVVKSGLDVAVDVALVRTLRFHVPTSPNCCAVL